MIEGHDDLEEIATVRFHFADGQRSEAFQIAPDPVLFLGGEAHADQGLQEIDDIHRGDEIIVLVLPIDTGDDDFLRGVHSVCGWNSLTVADDFVVVLASPETHEAALVEVFLFRPVLHHRLHVPLDH